MRRYTPFLLFTGLLISSGISCSAQSGEQAAIRDTLNPLKGDIRVHDPSMIKDGGTYYVYSTGMGIPFKTSPDRIHWKNAGRVFSKNSIPAWFTKDIPKQKGDVWAPDIHYYNGKYYLYYAVSAWMNFHSSIGLATNTTLNPNDPDYQWIDRDRSSAIKTEARGLT